MGTSFMPEIMKSSDVNPVEWRFTPILPLAFGAELSYMEMVAKLMQKVNEIIINDNAQNDNVNALLEAFKAWEKYLNENTLADGGVTTAKLANGAVTTEKLADGAVDYYKLADYAVGGRHLSPECVNGEHILLGCISAAHIGDNQITEAKLADGSVYSNKLANNCVTNEKLREGSVTMDKLSSEVLDLLAQVNGYYTPNVTVEENSEGRYLVFIFTASNDSLPSLPKIRVNIGASGSSEGEHGVGSGVYYNCQNYDVHPDNSDNTSAMQALIDLVHDKGGGIIWMPAGVYRFDGEHSSKTLGENCQTCLVAKPGVSILGESLTETVVQVYGNTLEGAAWIANLKTDIVYGCTYQNFTVDLADETIEQYTHKGKAFHQNGLKDCVFRDLRILNTPATGLGIDRLDNVVVDSVYVYNCGREWSMGGPGGAGIGIGTGMFDNENFVVRNCVCDSCGHFGIFLEDQGLFQNQHRNYPKGQIIANNIVRNGRHYGIGIRGGKNVVVTGNNLYENYGGIYLDMGAKNVSLNNNHIADYDEAGVLFGNEHSGTEGFIVHPCENVVVAGNTFVGNNNTIVPSVYPSNSQFANNYHIADTTGLIEVESHSMIVGSMLNANGSQADETNGLVTDYLDISGFANEIEITTIGEIGPMRICQYGSRKQPLEDNSPLLFSTVNKPQVISKLDLAQYLRIYYAPVDNSRANVEKVVVKGYEAPPSSLNLNASSFTIGVKLNPDGSEGSTTYGQTSDYLDVTGIAGNFEIKAVGTVDQVRVCQYDSNKNSLDTNAPALPASGVLLMERKDNCAFIRINFTSVGGSPASIQSVTVRGASVVESETIKLNKSDLVVGVKIEPDGSEGTTTSGMASDYVTLPFFKDNLKVTIRGTGSSVRIAQYNMAKGSLSNNFPTTSISDKTENILNVEMLTGCKYVRFYFTSLGEGQSADIDSVVIEQG